MSADGQSLFMIIAIIGFAPWLFFVPFCLMKLFAKLKAMASAAAAAEADAGAGDDGDDGDDDEGDDGKNDSSEMDEVLNEFLDAGFTKGLDDSPDIDINPVMIYKMNQAKKRAREAARLAAAAGEADAAASGGDGGGGGGGGKPGGLARLGWKLTKKGQKEEKKNQSAEVKGIEMYLSREEDIDVKHHDVQTKKIAGDSVMKPGRMEIARSKEPKSNLGRVGGRRGSAMGTTAQVARRQLGELKETKPQLFKVTGGGGGGGDGGGAPPE